MEKLLGTPTEVEHIRDIHVHVWGTHEPLLYKGQVS